MRIGGQHGEANRSLALVARVSLGTQTVVVVDTGAVSRTNTGVRLIDTVTHAQLTLVASVLTWTITAVWS